MWFAGNFVTFSSWISNAVMDAVTIIWWWSNIYVNSSDAIKMMLWDTLLIFSNTNQRKSQIITVNFKNFNSLRLIKVKSPFEVDQEKCKWDLDLYSSTKESSHTSIKKVLSCQAIYCCCLSLNNLSNVHLHAEALNQYICTHLHFIYKIKTSAFQHMWKRRSKCIVLRRALLWRHAFELLFIANRLEKSLAIFQET